MMMMKSGFAQRNIQTQLANASGVLLGVFCQSFFDKSGISHLCDI